MKIRVPQPQENDGDGDDDVGRGWVEHPFTKRLAATAAQDERAAFDRLVSGAKSSSDPKVVAYAAEYLHCKAVSDLTAGRWEKK